MNPNTHNNRRSVLKTCLVLQCAFILVTVKMTKPANGRLCVGVSKTKGSSD
jgi:hypothetical protein